MGGGEVGCGVRGGEEGSGVGGSVRVFQKMEDLS